MITPKRWRETLQKDCGYLADSEQSVRKTGRVCKLSQYHPHGRGRTGIFLLMREPLQGGSRRLTSGIKEVVLHILRISGYCRWHRWGQRSCSRRVCGGHRTNGYLPISPTQAHGDHPHWALGSPVPNPASCAPAARLRGEHQERPRSRASARRQVSVSVPLLISSHPLNHVRQPRVSGQVVVIDRKSWGWAVLCLLQPLSALDNWHSS